MHEVMSTGVFGLATERGLARLGSSPQVAQALTMAPAHKDSYLALLNMLCGESGRFGPKLALKISLLFSEHFRCTESSSLFSSAAMAHMSSEDIAMARGGKAIQVKEQALLTFVQKLLRQDVEPTPVDVGSFKLAGWSDEDVAEVFGHLTLNYLTHHFWSIARPQLKELIPRAIARSHSR